MQAGKEEGERRPPGERSEPPTRAATQADAEPEPSAEDEAPTSILISPGKALSSHVIEWNSKAERWTAGSWLEGNLTRRLRGKWEYTDTEDIEFVAVVIAAMLNDGDIPDNGGDGDDAAVCLKLATNGALTALLEHEQGASGRSTLKDPLLHRRKRELSGRRVDPAPVYLAAAMRSWGLRAACESEWGTAKTAETGFPMDACAPLKHGRQPAPRDLFEWMTSDDLWLGEDGRMMERAEIACRALAAEPSPHNSGLGWLALHLVGLPGGCDPEVTERAEEVLRRAPPDLIRAVEMAKTRSRASACLDAVVSLFPGSAMAAFITATSAHSAGAGAPTS